FPYETIISVFAQVGIGASFHDKTPDRDFEQKVNGWRALPESKRTVVANALLELNAEDVRQFMAALERTASRQIEIVRVLPLYGTSIEFTAIANAVAFVEGFSTEQTPHPFTKHEIMVRFTNGNSILATFFDNISAIQFLRGYLPPPIHIVEDEARNNDSAKRN
ncbi:MAG: hypothetical protein ACRDHP_17260, partial [Ktedonobacterales bacterium]